MNFEAAFSSIGIMRRKAIWHSRLRRETPLFPDVPRYDDFEWFLTDFLKYCLMPPLIGRTQQATCGARLSAETYNRKDNAR